MVDKLQPYEISLWDDILVEEDGKTYYKEVKIATIGSNTMVAPSRAIDPIFTANVNGEITLTFSIVHKYYDTLQNDYITNPFEKFLINERKVKLYYDNEWYDFVIKSCEESSDSNTFEYTAKGLFVNELGKVGYNIVLSNDLKNNQGSIFELAEKVVESTDWIIDRENSDIIQQFVAEPLYVYKNDLDFEAIDLQTNEAVDVEAEETLFLFYSTIANSQTENIFFLREKDFEKSTLDDNNVAQMPNYRFVGEANLSDAPSTIIIGELTLTLQGDVYETGINTDFQGYRLAYNPITTYDTVKERSVTVYEATYDDGSKKTIYKYTDYEYITSDVVLSYISDGSNFNIYGGDGSISGWSNATPTNKASISKSISGLAEGEELGSSLQITNVKEILASLHTNLASLAESFENSFYYTIIADSGRVEFIYNFNNSGVEGDSLQVRINNDTTYSYTYNGQQTGYITLQNFGQIVNISANTSIKNIINESLSSYIIFTTSIEDGGYVLQPLELASYPKITNKTIIDLAQLNGIKSYLKVKFNSLGGPGYNFNNTIYNDGINDYKSQIGNFSKGEEYVFRICYGTTVEDGARPQAINDHSIRAVVAGYTLQSQKIWNEKTQSYETVYLYNVNENDILFNFDQPFEKRNNEITGGFFRTNGTGDYIAYYKDGVIVTPSVDYCYKEERDDSTVIEAVWDLDNQVYKVKNDGDLNFLNYYHTIASCQKAVSNDVLSGADKNYGIFLYTDDPNLLNKYVYIKEVQLFKAKKDAEGKITLVGNIPQAAALSTDYFYIKPESSETDPNTIETYSTIDALLDSLGANSINLLYNENYEKISSIEASQSNCFNIIQELCETFECWAKFTIDHEKNGAVKLDSKGVPFKKISFHKYSGDDNFAGFKYGINLNSIQRTFESDEFVSKLIVEEVANDTVEGGVVSITGAPSNPSGESYILNMSYYLNHGLIENPQDFYKDYNLFMQQLKEKNVEYSAKKAQWQLAARARMHANSNNTVYTDLIEKARQDYTETILQFEEMTGLTYENYGAQNGYTVIFERSENVLVGTYSNTVASIVPSFFDANGEEILLTVTSEEESVGIIRRIYGISSENEGEVTLQDICFIGIARKLEGFNILKYNGSYSNYISRWPSMNPDIISQTIQYIWEFDTINSLTIDIAPADDNEALIKLVGKIYIDKQTDENYSALLEVSKEEKKELDLLIDGTKNYALTVSTFSKTVGGVQVDNTKSFLDDYLSGLKFALVSENGTWTVETSSIEKTFSQDKLYTEIYFLHYPKNYQLKYVLDGKTYLTSDAISLSLAINGSKTFTLVPIEESQGLNSEMEQILNEKKEIEKKFYKKYSRFIQEGSWTSSDYIDNELYYLDALNVSRVSGQPKASYSLSVYEISEQEGLENYKFKVGDKTYIEDVQFFGYHNEIIEEEFRCNAIDNIITLPNNVFSISDVYIIVPGDDLYDHRAHYEYVSGINTIRIVDNVYDTDEFLVILKYKIQTPIREEVVVSETAWHLDDPAENVITIQNYKTQFEDLFQRMAATVQSVEYNKASYSRAASVLDEGGFINAGLLLSSLNELNGGFYLSGNKAIASAPDGIIIKDLTDPSRQIKFTGRGIKTSNDTGYNWNTIITADGINIDSIDTQKIVIKDGDNPSFRWDAYGLNAYGFNTTQTDLKTYVRFDKYGLYGVQNGEDFQAETLTDIKDKAQFGLLWDGFFIRNSYIDGYVSISSDNDFQVVANNQERIKIGALGRNDNNAYEYGIRITNSRGNPVFITDDSGDIEMTGVINAKGGTFTDEISVGSGSNSIILRGGLNDAVIGSSHYFDNTSKGWAISADGDAVFNNITARGAIKTAVFEYSEIEAVGGIFMFRPSSTIREAGIPSESEYEYRKVVPEGESSEGYILNENEDYFIIESGEYILVSNPVIEDIDDYYVIDDETIIYSNDLFVKVENPLLFKVGDWCKVSNYTPEDPDSPLASNGLINIYEISDITDGVLTLENGAEMFADVLDPVTYVEINEIEGTGSNNVYTLTDVTDPLEPKAIENLTQKYFYDILLMSGESTFAEGTPKTLIITNNEVTYPIYYLGNLSLWNDDEEYDTEETYLFITINDQTLLYVGEGNDYYSEQGNNQPINLSFEKSFRLSYEVDSLIGGALISFGNYPTTALTPELTNNYGIGINSLDSAVNLPARAISLFESEIYPENSIKVGYNLRGVLGTLPRLGNKADLCYQDYMEGTQGIYTDNMYIGNKDQYIAFYTDTSDNDKKKLRINGADIYLTFGQGQQKENLVEVINGIETGEGLFLSITSSSGTEFDDSNIRTTLIAHLYKEGEEVLPESGSQQTTEDVINALGYQINWYTYTTAYNYVKTTDTAIDSTKTYYIYENDQYSIVETPVTSSLVDYYEYVSTATETLIKSNSVTCVVGPGANTDVSAVDAIEITAKLEDISNSQGD